MSEPVQLLSHAIARDALCALRDTHSRPAQFREALGRLTTLLAAQATSGLRTVPRKVETPLCDCIGEALQGRIGVVPILRAGLSMVDPFLSLLPDAEVWHLGFYRDEETLQPVSYYQKLPQGKPVEEAFVLDPMLATGGSAAAALRDLQNWGVPRLHFLGILGAPEGLQRLQEEFPTVTIHLCALDERLNEQGYIVPGLGDAGDRAFNATAE